MDKNNIFKEEFYYKNMFNQKANKSNNNLRKIKLDEKRFSFNHKRYISNALSSPNLFNNSDKLSYNYINNMQNNRNINSKIQISKKASINQNYLRLNNKYNYNNNYHYLKKDINNNAFNNFNSFTKKNNNYSKENSFANNTYNSKQNKDINSENLIKLKKPCINSYKDIKKIKDDYFKDEDSNLSDIADELIKSIQKDKKKLIKSNSSKNNTNIKNKKMIASKLYKGNTPQNYTFKTLFVNNFCIVPMNSSLIGKNDTNNEVKNINYGNMTLNKNINNSINNTDKDCTYYPKFNHNNYIYPKMINRQKTFSNNQIKNIENRQKKIRKMNKNNIINNPDTKSLLEFKNICYKKMNNSKKKQEIIFKDDKILKENDFNEDYYYTTMDLSNLDFAVNNNNLLNTNKKHVTFDLTQNVSFIYNNNDYIYKCKIYTKNNNGRIKNLRKNSKPIIKKFNKDDIKINKKYILNERLKEKEIVTDFFKIFSDGDFWS